MKRLVTNLDTNLGAVIREQLDDNFEKIQSGSDDQMDSINNQILNTLGDVAPQDKNEVTQARIDEHGKAYQTLKSREDVTQSTAETALKEGRDTAVEVQHARTNYNSQTFSDLKGRLDNQEINLNNTINDKLSKISYIPETIENINDLKSKYPNGKPGLFVTADTGHKYIWSNGSWVDAGVYQAVGLSRNSVTIDKVDKVNATQVINTSSVVSAAKPWSNAFVNIDNEVITFSLDTSKTGKDFGVSIPVFLDKNMSHEDSLYLNFDYVGSGLSGDDYANRLEVWLLDSTQKMIKNLNPIFAYVRTNKQSYQLTIPGDTLLAENVGNSFYLMLAVHNDITVQISNYRTNWDNSGKQLINNEKGNKVVVDAVRKSSTFDQDYSLAVNNGTITASSHKDRPVIEVPYFGLDLSKPVYFSLETIIDSDNYHGNYWISRLATTTPHADIKNGHSVTNIVMEPNELAQKGVAKDGVITITAGIDEKAKIVIEHISLSNNPVDGDMDYAFKKIDKTTVSRNLVKIGQPVNNIGTAKAKTVAGIDYVTPKQTYTGSNGIVKSIEAYVQDAGDYTFKVAKIDQNNLIVDSTSDFTVNLVSGYNDIDVEDRNILVPDGAQVFMNASSAAVYESDGSHLYVTTSLIRDQSHPTNNPSYPGQMMYNAGLLIPFNYSVIDQSPSKALETFGSRLGDAESELSDLSAAKDSVIIKSASGKKFRLVVSDDGVISAVSQIPNEVAIFGNSLTKERGNIGMSASDQYHDWYHYVVTYIKSKNSNAKFNERTNVSSWEAATTSSARQTVFEEQIKPTLSASTDLVILQLVDNVNTDEKLATFAEDAKTLIKNIHTVSPKARVLWVAGWFVDQNKLNMIKEACEQNNATLVNIMNISQDPSNKGTMGMTRTGTDGSTWTVTNSGEALHPGDKGMKLIADAVIGNFDF